MFIKSITVWILIFLIAIVVHIIKKFVENFHPRHWVEELLVNFSLQISFCLFNLLAEFWRYLFNKFFELWDHTFVHFVEFKLVRILVNGLLRKIKRCRKLAFSFKNSTLSVMSLSIPWIFHECHIVELVGLVNLLLAEATGGHIVEQCRLESLVIL